MKKNNKIIIVFALSLIMIMCFSLSVSAATSTSWSLHYAKGAPTSDNVITQYRSVDIISTDNLAVNTIRANHTFSWNKDPSVSTTAKMTITSSSFSTITLSQTSKSASRTVSKYWPTVNCTMSLTGYNGHNYVSSNGQANITCVL